MAEVGLKIAITIDRLKRTVNKLKSNKVLNEKTVKPRGQSMIR